MKKMISLTLVLLMLIACMTSCELLNSMIGEIEESTESALKVTEMLTALSEKRMDDAKRLMHPNASYDDAALEQLAEIMKERNVVSMIVMGVNVRNEVGTNGNVSTEELSYKTTLSDGTIIYVSSVYVSDNSGVGFTSFRISFGIA